MVELRHMLCGEGKLKCENCGSEMSEEYAVCPNCGGISEHTLITRQRKPLMLGGRYSVVAVLGRGGFGTVYLARDTQLGETVAVKTLPIEVTTDSEAVEQLKKEVLLARQLHHENIAAVYNFEVDNAREIPFIVMEYVDGADLSRILKEAGGRISVAETLIVVSQVAAALDYAHSKRFIHRDIKPKNILVRRDGVAKVTDFGVARRLHETMTRISQSVIAGTPAYMAPEHIMGEPIDQTADIYSLAATVYECLCGHPPFWRGSIEVQILNRPPQPIPYEELGPDISPESAKALNEAILKGLAKNSKDRPKTASEFVRLLKEAVGDAESDRTVLAKPVVAALKERAKYMKPLNDVSYLSTFDAADINQQAEEAFEQGEFAKAIWLLQRLQKISPSEKTEERIREIKKLQDRYHELRLEAKEYEARSELEEALRLMEEALNLRPSEEVRKEVERLQRKLEAEKLHGKATIALAEKDWERLKEYAEKIEELGFKEMAASIRNILKESELFLEFSREVEEVLNKLDERRGEGGSELLENLMRKMPSGLKYFQEDIALKMEMVGRAVAVWEAVKKGLKALKEKPQETDILKALDEIRKAGLDIKDFASSILSGDLFEKYPYIGKNLREGLMELWRMKRVLDNLFEAEEYFVRGLFSLAARKYASIPDHLLTPKQRERRDQAIQQDQRRRKRQFFYIAITILTIISFFVLVVLLS